MSQKRSPDEIIAFFTDWNEQKEDAIKSIELQVKKEMSIRKRKLLEDFLKGKDISHHFSFTIEWDFYSRTV